MNKLSGLAIGLGLLAVVGCSHDYGKVRPPVDELSDNGRGLQGKDVVSASDRMASELLASPALNASKTQWTIVVDRVENLSSSRCNCSRSIVLADRNLCQHGVAILF